MKSVNVAPVLVLFLILLVVVGLGSVVALPPLAVLGAFLLVVVLAFAILARNLFKGRRRRRR